MYPKLELAMAKAVEWHQGQYRDGEFALPYATHPFDVLHKLHAIGKVSEEELLCTAMLHDVLEETEATQVEIAKLFGTAVATLVVELTREEPDDEAFETLDEKDLYELRNRLLLDGIRKMSPSAMAVKLADRLSNLEEAKRTRTKKCLERYRNQTDQILAIIPKRTNPALWKAVKASRQST